MQVVVGLQKGQDVFTLESGLLAMLILTNLAGAVTGWWNSATGVKILLIGGVALSIFSAVVAGRNRDLALAISGLPFLLSSFLLWVSQQTQDVDDRKL